MGLRTTLRCFQLLTGKKRIQLRFSSNSDACSQGSARSTYDATKKIATAVHTYTSSPSKILFTNLRIPPINEDQFSTKLDSDQATRPEGIEEDTVHNVRWSMSFGTPLISLLGPDTKTTFLSFGATEHDNP